MSKLIRVSFFLKIILPALLAILFFITSVFLFTIPSFERNAMEQKKNMIHELTNTSWSILLKYHNDNQKGLLTLDQAKQMAVGEIESLRYGLDKKDYFWITDLTPLMIMHPYIPELQGEDLRNYTDPDGKRVFTEAVKIAVKQGEGFINYKWQHKDKVGEIVPKMSFIKIFEPWGWIIGTGVYLDDVQDELMALKKKMVIILLGITFIIAIIIFFIAYQSLKIDTRRREAEASVIESKEKYRSLLESSTEGIILLLNYKISYSNSFIQNWLQYTGFQLTQLELTDIISPEGVPDIQSVTSEIRKEVNLIRKDGTETEAILTILPVSFSDKEGLLLTFKDSHEHLTLKAELKELKSRFSAVWNNANIGLFRLPLTGKNRVIEHNRALVSMLGYTASDERDSSLMHPTQMFADKKDLKRLLKLLGEHKSVKSSEIALRKKDGTLALFNITLIITNDKYCDGIVESNSGFKGVEELSQTAFDLASASILNDKPVFEYAHLPVIASAGISLSGAIELMHLNRSDYVLLMLNDTCLGIITLRTIIDKLAQTGSTSESPASDYMTSPVIFGGKHTTVSEAIILMERENHTHLLIKDAKGPVCGVVDKCSLLGVFSANENAITSAIKKSTSISQLPALRAKIAGLVRPMLDQPGFSSAVTKIISNTNEHITKQIFDTAIKQLGTPPVPFAFVSLGSEGRNELVFSSDQDNALIFSDSNSNSSQNIKEYFNKLSHYVCQNLNASGLPLCPGGYMASNTQWCQPLSVWKEYFREWIVNAEPENIMNISVFFDLKFIYGDRQLFSTIEDFVFENLEGESAFFYFLASSATNFKPPVGIFGNIVTESAGKKSDIIEIKKAQAQIVAFARLFALHNNIRVKGTIERINALCKEGVLSQQTTQEVLFHYNFLMMLRLRHQSEQLSRSVIPDNMIPEKSLTDMDIYILKKVFSQMNSYNQKIGATFMSAYKG